MIASPSTEERKRGERRRERERRERERKREGILGMKEKERK